MDVKIDNMDISKNSCGDAVYLNSFDELLQRVKIACTIKKGSFVYDRNFGVEISDIDFNDDMLPKKLEMIYKEATINIGYDNLKVVKVDKDNKTATICVVCGEFCETVEVTING